MDNRNDMYKSIVTLFALFCAIVLTDNTTGVISLIFVVFMGVILISLCMASIVFPGKQRDDTFEDH